MKIFLIISSVVVCGFAAAAPPSYTTETPSDDNDDDNKSFLNPTNTKERACKTRDNREGLCVDFWMCSKDMNIELGGNIDPGILRVGDCPDLQWCCVHPNRTSTVAPETSPPPPQGCRTGLKDSCPWCVAIYRKNPQTGDQELFCGGVVVGSRLVLTSASCAQAFRRSDLWARLPGSTKQYKTNSTVKHQEYNSGSRENDIAFLQLEEDIEWPEGGRDGLGACLGLKTPLKGDCIAMSFDDADKLKFTPVTVTANSCAERGSSSDAACGRATGSCSVAPGSPVLCPSDGINFIVAGLVRQVCVADSTLLGSLMTSADWVTEELSKLAVATSQYTIIS